MLMDINRDNSVEVSVDEVVDHDSKTPLCDSLNVEEISKDVNSLECSHLQRSLLQCRLRRYRPDGGETK